MSLVDLEDRTILVVRRSPRSKEFRKRIFSEGGFYALVGWPYERLIITTSGLVNFVGSVFNSNKMVIRRENQSDALVDHPFWGKIFSHGDILVQSTGGGEKLEIDDDGYQRPVLTQKLISDEKDGVVKWKKGRIFTLRQTLSVLLIPLFYAPALAIFWLVLGGLFGFASPFLSHYPWQLVVYFTLQGILVADLVILVGIVLGQIVPN